MALNTTTRLGPSAVSANTKLASSVITPHALAAGAVSANTKLASGVVTTHALATSAVTTAKITDANITTAKLADSSVTTAKITDANITTAKLADSCVTAAKIAASGRYPGGDISGLTVSNSGSTNTKYLNIEAGKCRDRAYSWAFTVDTGGLLTNSLAAYWKLNEASGIRKDTYGWGDVVGIRAAPVGAEGKISGAAHYNTWDGSGVGGSTVQGLFNPGSIPLKTATGNINFTWAGWVQIANTSQIAIFQGQPTTSADRQMQLYYHGGGTNRFVFQWYTDAVGTFVEVSATTFGAPSANTWYFLTAYHDAGTNTMGISVNNGAFNTTTATGGNSSATGAVEFGMQNEYGGNGMNGKLCEIGLWFKLLSSQEITDLYNSGTGQTLTETISDSVNINCAAMTEKKLNVAWSTGSTGGLLDTGAIAASTTYHIFAIAKTDGTQDYVASLNPKKPALPTGYTYYRRIRSVRTDSSTNIVKEKQTGHTITYNAVAVDVNFVFPASASAVVRTMSAPTGISVRAFGTGHVENSGNIVDDQMVSSMETVDVSPAGSAIGNIGSLSGTAKSNWSTSDWALILSKSAQLRSRTYSAHADSQLYLDTRGYDDLDILGAGR